MRIYGAPILPNFHFVYVRISHPQLASLSGRRTVFFIFCSTYCDFVPAANICFFNYRYTENKRHVKKPEMLSFIHLVVHIFPQKNSYIHWCYLKIWFWISNFCHIFPCLPSGGSSIWLPIDLSSSQQLEVEAGKEGKTQQACLILTSGYVYVDGHIVY